jgi:hypothetical protein
MKNDSLWRDTLVVAFAIGAGWIGYMGWPLNGLITRAAEQSIHQIARRHLRCFKIQIVPETTSMRSCAVL